MSDDKKVIFSMNGVSKIYPGSDHPVLKKIYLSFLTHETPDVVPSSDLFFLFE